MQLTASLFDKMLKDKSFSFTWTALQKTSVLSVEAWALAFAKLNSQWQEVEAADLTAETIWIALVQIAIEYSSHSFYSFLELLLNQSNVDFKVLNGKYSLLHMILHKCYAFYSPLTGDDLIGTMVQRGISLARKNEDDFTPLQRALYDKDFTYGVQVVNLLMKYGVQFNPKEAIKFYYNNFPNVRKDCLRMIALLGDISDFESFAKKSEKEFKKFLSTSGDHTFDLAILDIAIRKQKFDIAVCCLLVLDYQQLHVHVGKNRVLNHLSYEELRTNHAAIFTAFKSRYIDKVSYQDQVLICERVLSSNNALGGLLKKGFLEDFPQYHKQIAVMKKTAEATLKSAESAQKNVKPAETEIKTGSDQSPIQLSSRG